VRPLPRVLALTDDDVADRDDFGIRAAAIAAVGPAVAIVARRPAGTTDQLALLAQRVVALARPPMATVWVTARADVARACGASGVVLREGDPAPADARGVGGALTVARSVHRLDEARQAVTAGADALIVGAIWETATHPGAAPAGLGLVEQVASLGVPVYAIGGVSSGRAEAAQRAGAWGVAAIRAIWDAPDSYRATLELLAPWQTR
jgi:thiamine-phosphate diphosphorylase